MNIRSLLLLSVALLLTVFTGCKKGGKATTDTTPYATFGSTEVEIAAHVDELVLNILTVDVEWTLSKDEASTWLTINGDLTRDSTSNMYLDIEKNTSLENREAFLELEYILYAGSTTGLDTTVVKELKIIQLGETQQILLKSDTVYVDSKAQRHNEEVLSNLDWKVTSSASWLKASSSPIKTVVESTLSLDFEENTSPNFRMTTIELTGGDNDAVAKLVVYQYGTSTLESDMAVLKELYSSTGGANWTTPWDMSKPITEWAGVTVAMTVEGDRVVGLDLSKNNLKGSIPRSIGELQYLELLSLGDNELSGTIPTVISDIYFLRYLYLQNNKLTGEIPVSLASLRYLNWVHLGDNELSGEIPSELGVNAADLSILGLAGNNLTGTLPKELGKSEVLDVIYVEGNRLSGAIPESYKNNILWNSWTPSKYIVPQQDGYVLK